MSRTNRSVKGSQSFEGGSPDLGGTYERDHSRYLKKSKVAKFKMAKKSTKMAQTPIFDHLGSSYQFLTKRKVISGQNYYRNTQDKKKFDFFAKKIFSSICQHWQKCPNSKIRFLKHGSSNIAEILHAIRPYIGLIAYEVSLA